MKITDGPGYILGPMTGYPKENRPAFDEMAKLLRGQGLEVINPSELDESDPVQPREETRAPNEKRNIKYTPEPSWEDYIRRDLPHIAKAKWGFALAGWEESKGASIEAFFLGRVLECPIYEMDTRSNKLRLVDSQRIPDLVRPYGL